MTPEEAKKLADQVIGDAFEEADQQVYPWCESTKADARAEARRIIRAAQTPSSPDATPLPSATI